jgi:hypothetical protein
VVAKVIRDNQVKNEGLNLSNESSASEEDETMETYELNDIFSREQIVPDG